MKNKSIQLPENILKKIHSNNVQQSQKIYSKSPILKKTIEEKSIKKNENLYKQNFKNIVEKKNFQKSGILDKELSIKKNNMNNFEKKSQEKKNNEKFGNQQEKLIKNTNFVKNPIIFEKKKENSSQKNNNNSSKSPIKPLIKINNFNNSANKNTNINHLSKMINNLF